MSIDESLRLKLGLLLQKSIVKKFKIDEISKKYKKKNDSRIREFYKLTKL